MEAIPRFAADSEEDATASADERLALRAGTDADAFGALYMRHRDAVFRYLRARCRDEDVAVELTAVTFEKALRNIHRYRSQVGGGVLAWLLRIARNSAADYERRQRPLIPQWRIGGERNPQPSAEDQVMRSDERRRVRLLVAELPELQRDALAMRFGADLTAREIGDVIGKSEEATQKLISRAIARLREVAGDRF